MSEPAATPTSTDRYTRRARVLGWVATGMSTVLASMWAFWGIIENFHEGWYNPALAPNLALLFTQYLMPMLVFLGAALVGIGWPRVGGLLHIAGGAWAIYYFRRGAGEVFIGLPLIALGLLWWFGRPSPRRRAAQLLLLFPLLVLIGAGAEPVWRVAGRVDDGNRGERDVSGNGVHLVWAARGPGWPDRGGLSWLEANERCSRLDAAGSSIVETAAPGIWRLPTVAEAVASLTRHAVNAQGRWESASGRASYRVRPDKESPLWDPHSPIIYWWTASDLDDDEAYMITYAGGVFVRRKGRVPTYFGFRCVRAP